MNALISLEYFLGLKSMKPLLQYFLFLFQKYFSIIFTLSFNNFFVINQKQNNNEKLD